MSVGSLQALPGSAAVVDQACSLMPAQVYTQKHTRSHNTQCHSLAGARRDMERRVVYFTLVRTVSDRTKSALFLSINKCVFACV